MDNRILQQLYESYGKEIRLYLFSLCKDWDLAEDLMQETFVKALLSLSEQHTNMRAWLYLVARNLCFSVMKREKRSLLTEDVERQEVSDALSGYSQLKQRGGILRRGEGENVQDDILGKLILKEQNRILYKALLELAHPKREILELYYFSELSLKEIAGMLQLTTENTRLLSYRAKKELRKKLEEAGYEIS